VLAVLDLATQVLLVVLGIILVLDRGTLVHQVHVGTAPTWTELIFALRPPAEHPKNRRERVRKSCTVAVTGSPHPGFPAPQHALEYGALEVGAADISAAASD
jgi:hypothetical protein